MADREQLDILKQGAEAWNRWRSEDRELWIDLSNINLSGADLSGADLHGVYLTDAYLSGVNLQGANLNLARLSMAYLSDANLHRADLGRASLRETDLRNANLSQADLSFANITGTKLSGANLHRAKVLETTFGDVDLSMVMALDTIAHGGPSTIGIDTIYRSQGKIPEAFLKGAGVPDSFIEHMRSLVGSPIDYYSCFISYSSNDQAFAERLRADLQSKGVRCWFAPEDMKIGDEIRVRIDESIRVYDKLLIVLSEHSAESTWVEDEVEAALEKERVARERGERRTVLFPIQLDESIKSVTSGWPAKIRRTRHIGDFRQWKQRDEYQKAFARLLRDLQAQ